MKFYSTHHQVKNAGLKKALYDGFAPDGGLYLPENLPQFSLKYLKNLRGASHLELSIELSKQIFREDLEPAVIEKICEEAFDFPLPFLSLSKEISVLELFHGPTLSFKDFGARFLARLMRSFREEATVLVATSGDTGSAVGQAFYAMPEIRVFILYAKGRVAPLQELQLTTIGHNVHAVQVDAGFEECQEMLKKAVLDPELAHVTTANSINVGRILSQALYYFYAYLQLPDFGKDVIFSVPCGNYGHLVSGILAKRMGLPIRRFVVATNINEVVPLFLKTGVFQPHPAYKTLSVSMDVGNPSNFERLLELYNSNLEALRQDLFGLSYTDEETKRTIFEVYEEKGYLLDPHSAIAYAALRDYFKQEKNHVAGIFFATAHPAKFPEALSFAEIPEPLQLSQLALRAKKVITIPNDYDAFKELLIQTKRLSLN